MLYRAMGILSATWALLTPANAMAYDPNDPDIHTVGNYVYEIKNYAGEEKFVRLVGVKDGYTPKGEITIPGSVTIEGVKYPMKRIGGPYNYYEWFKYEPVFNNYPEITKVTISSPIEEIVPREFSGCTGITEFHVNAGSKNFADIDGILIHREGEEYHWGLFRVPPGRGKTKYTVPDEISHIGPFAFLDNTTIKTVVLSPFQEVRSSWTAGNRSISEIQFATGSSSTYRLIDGMLYTAYDIIDSKTRYKLVTCPPRLRLDKYVIPTNCVKIASGAFANTVIPEIKIHDNCRLDTYVFAGSKIQSLKYNNDMQNYLAGLCVDCTDLIRADITTENPDERTVIFEDMFRGCSSMTALSTASVEIAVLEGAFYGCGLKTFPWEKVTYIAGATYEQMTYDGYTFATSDIESITFPSRFYCVPRYFAYGCRNLKSVTIDPDGTGETEIIGQHAFENCTSLESITFTTAKEIGYQSFYGCSALKRIVFADQPDREEICVSNPFQFEDGVKVYIGNNRYYWGVYPAESGTSNATFITSSLSRNSPTEWKRLYCPALATEAYSNSSTENQGDVVEFFSILPSANRPALMVAQNIPAASELSFTVTGVTIGGEKASLNNGFWSIDGTGPATDRDITINYTVDEVDMHTTYPAGEFSGIETVTDSKATGARITGIYTPDGLLRGTDMEKAPAGILLIRYADGSSRRIYRK